MTTAASNPHGGRNQQGEAQQWTGATVNNIQHRTHSKAPSTRTGFNQLQVTGPLSDEDDESTEGGHYGLRASVSGLLDGQDDLDDLPTNEEGNDYWVNSRHLTSGNPAAPSEEEVTAPPWRLRSRLKTFSAALILCLNLGIDPPDIVKTTPCAKLECWVDPESLPPNKALEGIGRNLQQQFETLSPKVRYKQYLDPSVEETKKFCVNLRRQAKDERILMYYNGHGVPKPTASGEIWVFNKNLTQYIPVSLYDLQSWLGSPCIFVWDCSAAGNILSNFNRWAERRDADASTAGGQQRQQSGSPDDPNSPSEGTYTPFLDCIHLAACEADQTLPMSPELPADLFTCCLTSPIEIALRFFVLQDPLRVNVDPSDPKAKITVDLVMKIPGDLKDRRTPLGELNWIFTAVTDTIAWLVFPHDIFKRLFRQDLLVAALFRNYLLAERIMRAYNCTPMSYPALPATHNHPLWNSWDLAVDACLNQLPALLEAEAKSKENPTAPPIYEYQPSRFFTEHLTAFEVWLQHDGSVSSHLSLKPKTPHLARKPPDQLPIVLQVLLSQAHRLRALILLSKFVDLGPWAVRLALSIGIFPYVQKLLQSPAVDLKPVLIFIWGRILAHDRSCQTDLLKDNGFGYFAKVLAPPSPQTAPLLIPNASEHRAMCAFILSMVCRGFKQGQMACMNLDVFGSCFIRLGEDDWLLKQWSALCIAQMWADGNDEAKMLAISEHYQDQLIFMLKDNAAEVRAAAMYAIGTFLGATGMPAGTGLNGSTTSGGGGTGAQIGMTERNQLKLEAGVAQACVLQAKEDASPLVRKELVVVLSCVAREWRGWFVAAAWTYHELEERKARRDMGDETDADDGEDLVSQAVREWGLRVKDQMDDPAFAEEEHQQNLVMLFIFKLMYSTLLDLSADPHPEVASLACTVTDYLTALLLDSAFTRATGSTLRVKKYEERTSRSGQSGAAIRPTLSTPALSNVGPTDPSESQTLTKPETPPSTTSKMTATLKRNSSIATALKSLASMTGYAAPPPEPETPPVQDAPPKLSRNNTPSNLHVQPYIPPYPMARTDTDADSSTSRGSSKVSRSASVASMVQSHMRSEFGFTSMHGDLGKPRKFSAAQVIQALTDEDMERLNIRRTSRTEAGGGADGKSANGGMPQAHELGLGMVAKEVKDDVLPLRSDFYDWTMQYFKQPQMRVPDTQEPGSKEYNEQSWRQQRNHGIVETSRTSDGLASHSPWTKDLGRLPNDSWPSIVQFHSFEPQLAVADDSDNVCIWDWKTKQRLSKFSLANGYGSSISSMHFINEASSSLLLTALTDGNIRIYHEYDSADVKLVSAFHGLAEKHPVSRRSGVVSSWERRTGQLLVGGDSKFIRIWDADDESLLADFPTQAGSNVTALASDQFGGDMFVAGFGDGVVRLFDKRMAEANGVVKVLRQHHTWIKTVGVVQGDGRDLISASMNGDVKIWDIRRSDIPISSTNAFANGLSSMSMHPTCPIFASTSAPYISSTYSSANSSSHNRENNHSSVQGQGPAGKGQKLNVYRMDDLGSGMKTPSSPVSSQSTRRDGSFASLNKAPNQKFSGLPHSSSSSTASSTYLGGGYGYNSYEASMGEPDGPQPELLSSILLRGDGVPSGSGNGNTLGEKDGFVDVRKNGGNGGGGKKRWGAGMNALSFHPNEHVLAVGGFDRANGGIRLISYESKKGDSRSRALE